MISQLVLLFCGLGGIFSDVSLEKILIFEKKVIYLLNHELFYIILNILLRKELLKGFIIFIVNIVKINLLVEHI
jgi:hypothetical protein